MTSERDDYDSPWKDAVERNFVEFMKFFFPLAYAKIDWTKGYVFLDQELRAVVRDAELGRRTVDKLVRVTLLSGEEDWIYIHIEVQGSRETGFGQRVFVCNYRLFDRYERPIASLVVLADETPNWRPDGFAYDVLGCRLSFQFPVVKLLGFAGREPELIADPNPFALVTAAHLMTQATRGDMAARFDAKWTLERILYQRGWDRQRIIDLFAVLDWLMRLPEGLSQKLHSNITELEEQDKMRYVTSVERFGCQRGRAEGEANALIRLLEKRFGPLPDDRRERIMRAEAGEIDAWLDRILDAPSPDAVLDGPSVH